jgi:hypothetical protein
MEPILEGFEWLLSKADGVWWASDGCCLLQLGAPICRHSRTNRQSTNYFFLLPDGRMDDDFNMYIVLTHFFLVFRSRRLGSVEAWILLMMTNVWRGRRRSAGSLGPLPLLVSNSTTVLYICNSTKMRKKNLYRIIFGTNFINFGTNIIR